MPGPCAPEDDSPAWLTWRRLYCAYLACRRNKRNKASALAFEARQELNLLELLEALRDRSYRRAPSVCFVTTQPKLREIFAADFRDRIVHHLLIEQLERYWEGAFIHDSYACRRGKGVHAAVDRLQRFLREETANATRPAFYLQLDVRNYFMTIDKEILWSLLAPKIRNPWVAWLTRLLVFHDCTQRFEYRGAPGLLERVPPHKSLLHCAPGTGLPIGNLNSQFFANVYLNELDQFVKHRLRCRAYLRYCDDFVLVASDVAVLRQWRDDIGAVLESRLRLQLNPVRQRLRPVSDGIDFVGYVIRPQYRLARRRVVNRMLERLRQFESQLVGEGSAAIRVDLRRHAATELHSTLSSYLGHLRWANSRRLTASLATRHPFLATLFEIDARLRRATMKCDLSPSRGPVRHQYARWPRQFPGSLILMQVGACWELYDHPDDGLAGQIGLRLLATNRRRARFAISGNLLRPFLRRALRLGQRVVLIEQLCPIRGLPIERGPRAVFEPTGLCGAAPESRSQSLSAAPHLRLHHCVQTARARPQPDCGAS